MKFYMPVRVYDEPECVKKHAKEIAQYGSKALIVTGRHSAAACGALDDVIAALKEYGRAYCVFSEVEENPSVETVMKAAVFGTEEKADFVIGIGGGSPLDAAKAAAFLMNRKEFAAEDLYNKDLKADALPVIAVATTCGTGSEVTGVSVLTVHEKQTKMSIPHRIFPVLGLVDGKYLASASRNMIISTSVDAFAHLTESYLSKSADTYSMSAALTGLSVWKEIKDVLLGKKEPDNEDFAKLMRASTFAGIAIAQTGTSVPHALSYILTYEQKIPHGRACGYSLAGFIGFAEEKDRRAIYEAAGFSDQEDLEQFMAAVLGEMQIDEKTLQRAYDTVSANSARMSGSRVSLDNEKLKTILRMKQAA